MWWLEAGSQRDDGDASARPINQSKHEGYLREKFAFLHAVRGRRDKEKEERERERRTSQTICVARTWAQSFCDADAGWPDDLMGRMCHSWGRAVGWLCWGQYKLNRRRMVKKPSRIGSCFLQSSAKKTCARETDFFCKVFSSQLKGMSDCRREPSHGNGLKETRKEKKTKKEAMQQCQESGRKSGNPKRNIPQL